MEWRPIESDFEQLQFKRLLSVAFPQRPGASFLDDFPVWDLHLQDRRKSEVLILGGFEGGHLVVAAGLRLTELMRVGPRPIPVGILGAVCVDPEFRGQGLATEVCSQLLALGDGQGVAATFLWGSEHNLYRRLGFNLCGRQITLPMSAALKPRLSWIRKQELGGVQTGFTVGVFKKMLERKDGLSLRETDLSWMSAHHGTQWFWVGPPDRPNAYLAVGKGIDLQGVVHEYGGDQATLLQLMDWVSALRSDLSWIGCVESARSLEFSFDSSQMDYLCMARITDPVGLIQGSSKSPLDPFDFSRVSPLELPAVLFGGPEGCLDEFSQGALDLHHHYRSTLPLPLWLWGLDGA
jgi:GNAT superfamily N-acetyltransferase